MNGTKSLQSAEVSQSRIKNNIIKLKKASQKRARPRLSQQAEVFHTPYSDQRLPRLTQESLLALLTFHNECALEIRSRLEPAHFDGLYREFATPVINYIDEYGKAPEKQIADLFATTLEKEDRNAKRYKKLITNLHAVSKDNNPDFVMSQLDTFINSQCLKSFTMDSMEAFTASSDSILDAGTLERLQSGMAEAMDASLGTSKWPEPLDLTALGQRESKPRRWVLEDIMPEGCVTLLAGHGGVGKTQIALQAAASIASGKPWMDVQVRRRRVLFLSGEDDQDTLEAWLYSACRHLGIPPKKAARHLKVYSLIGRDAVLWRERPTYGITSVYRQLKLRIKQHRTEVLVLDRNANFFTGNGNDNAQVNAFINSLIGLFEADKRRAVLLLGHVDKPSAANPKTSQGYLGSTEWHNAPRGRWYLWKEPDGTRRLVVKKSNLGPDGQTFRFTWDNDEGTFVGSQIDSDMLAPEDEDQAEAECASIIDAMTARLDQGQIVPTAEAGAYTAFGVLRKTGKLARSLSDTKAGRARFKRRLEELHAQGVVETAFIKRKNRHKVEVWQPKDVGEQGDD